MKNLLAVLICVLWAGNLLAQCPAGDITLSTQAEVDAFATTYPGCTNLNGALTISGADITDLSALSVITSVAQGFAIVDNPLLVNLNGLQNIATVGEPNGSHVLSISNNASLTSVTALSNLTFVPTNPGNANDLIIVNNPLLSSLDGLQSLAEYVYVFAVIDNDMLVNLQGLQNMTGADDLVIRGNQNLQSLVGLSALNLVGAIIIEDNPSLITLDGVTTLPSIERLTIDNNSLLTDIAEFNDIAIGAFNDLVIENNASLSLCSIASVCNRIAADNTTVFISNNDTGCNSVAEVTAGCVGCPTTPIVLSSQAEVDAFPTTYPLCTELQNSLTISGPDIMDLSPLSQITLIDIAISGELVITDNPLLTNLDGLENLTDVISGNIRIENNALLSNLNGLSGLNGFLGGFSLIIKDNPSLLSLQGLENVTHPGDDDLIIDNCDLLVDLTGLSGMIGADDVLIWNNDALESFEGMASFTGTGTLSVRDNSVLTTFDGMPQIGQIFRLDFQDNPLLNDIAEISEVTNLDADGMVISNNPELSFCSIESICTALGISSAFATIENNAPGCNSVVEVELECTTISGFTRWASGAWDNGAPDITKVARIEDNYNTSAEGSIDAGRLSIANGSELIIAANNYLNTVDDIVVNGNLIVEHTGSVVQVNADAEVKKNANGVINVELTTPPLKKKDFMVMGSPMDQELRNGVFDSAFLVLEHTPSNFIPHPLVPAGGTNFADDNNDFWNPMVGNDINIGEGYIVRPQSGYADPIYVNPGDAFTFDMVYSVGTLNNGNVVRNVSYNPIGNPDGTPNVLANPYPSALDATLLINFLGNSVLNEVYFWEHLTPPSPNTPGAGSINFSMDDISMFNGVMGIPAANDPGTGTTPNGIISTGQGFGIKAFADGQVTFTNAMRLTSGNTTLRNTEEIDKITLRVANETLKFGSYTGIAFSPNGTDDLDPKMDSNRLATAISLFSELDDRSEQLGIQTRGAFDETMVIPMGFASQVPLNTEFVVSIANAEGSNVSDRPIYLLDHFTGNVTDLSEEKYEFISDRGTFTERFSLYFSEEVLTLDNFGIDGIAIYPNPVSEDLNIALGNMLQLEQVTMYSVLGETVLITSEETIDMSSLSKGIYFLKIDTDQGSITKKIIKE